jgi:hypothetical protein
LKYIPEWIPVIPDVVVHDPVYGEVFRRCGPLRRAYPLAGFDRVSVSLRPRWGRAKLSPFQVPHVIGSFYRRRHTKNRTGSYRFRDKYQMVLGGPIVDLAYVAATPFLPPACLTVRGTIAELLTPAAIAEAVEAFERQFTFRHLVSGVELAIDAPGYLDETEVLATRLYVPGSRKGSVRRHAEYRVVEYAVRGSRRSAVSVKVYAKEEDGMQVARTEFTFRRQALRNLGVRRVADLCAVDWTREVTRRARFVESSVLLGGIIPFGDLVGSEQLTHEALERLSAVNRRRVRPGLHDVPHLMQTVHDTVDAFERSWKSVPSPMVGGEDEGREP